MCSKDPGDAGMCVTGREIDGKSAVGGSPLLLYIHSSIISREGTEAATVAVK